MAQPLSPDPTPTNGEPESDKSPEKPGMQSDFDVKRIYRNLQLQAEQRRQAEWDRIFKDLEIFRTPELGYAPPSNSGGGLGNIAVGLSLVVLAVLLSGTASWYFTIAICGMAALNVAIGMTTYLGREAAKPAMVNKERLEIVAVAEKILKEAVEEIRSRKSDSFPELPPESKTMPESNGERTEAAISVMRTLYEQCRRRLEAEVRRLSRRGNTNLIIGTVTTLGAVALLAEMALYSPLNDPDWLRDYHPSVDLWMWLIPSYGLRLSLVVFIEVFSFFFLRLYQASLAEIKYFQNELTNVELRAVALEMAALNNDAQSAATIMVALASSERNFTLKSGETTIELERERLKSHDSKVLVEQATALVKELKLK